MEIYERLDILKMAGQISENTYEQVLRIINYFNQEHLLQINEENGAMFITHLCIALRRMEQKEAIAGMEEEIYQEIRENSYYSRSKETLTHIEQLLGSTIPPEEKGYLMMHLCVLFEKTSAN